MQSSRPPLVIVGGSPASGKTTLARRLAEDLGLQLLSKDRIKEAMADAMGAPKTVAASSVLGAGAYAAMFAMARSFLAAGTGVVLESNFRRGLAEAELSAIGLCADVRVLHCVADAAAIDRRYAGRESERHAAHFDAARHPDVMRELLDGSYQPLEITAPRLIVRTDDGYEPSYDAVRAFLVKEASA